MNDVFETVDRGDLSFTALVGATNNENFIVFADGDRSDLHWVRDVEASGAMCTNIVLLTELLAERRTHDGTSDAGRGIVVSLARLSPRGVEGFMEVSTLSYGAIEAIDAGALEYVPELILVMMAIETGCCRRLALSVSARREEFQLTKSSAQWAGLSESHVYSAPTST